jgi:hypothetical protein
MINRFSETGINFDEGVSKILPLRRGLDQASHSAESRRKVGGFGTWSIYSGNSKLRR